MVFIDQFFFGPDFNFKDGIDFIPVKSFIGKLKVDNNE